LGIDDLENLAPARLADDGIEELLDAATECTLCFADGDGWPRGVVVSFARRDGSVYFTAVNGRRHTRSLRQDPRVSVVVSSAGTALDGRRMVAFRGTAVFHDADPDKSELLWLIAGRLAPADPAAMVRLLDSPNRVVMEIRPVSMSVSHDSRHIAGNGRGGAGEGGER